MSRAAADSAEYREPLTDALHDPIGHRAEHRAERGASRDEVCQKPSDMGCQFACWRAIVAVCECRNAGDVPLYAYQQDAHAQEDGADSEVDAEELSALRGAIRGEEAGDHERARGAREERRAEIEEPEDDNHCLCRGGDVRRAPRAVVRGPLPPSGFQVAAMEAHLPSPPDGTALELRIRFVETIIINRNGELYKDAGFRIY